MKGNDIESRETKIKENARKIEKKYKKERKSRKQHRDEKGNYDKRK